MLKIKDFEEEKELIMQATLKSTMKSSAYLTVAAIRNWNIHWEKNSEVETLCRSRCLLWETNVNHLKRVTSENTLMSMLLIVAASKHQFFPYESEIHYQAGFRKCRETRYQIANICWIIKKAREFQKTSTSALLTMPKTVWITTNCRKFLKR